MTSLYQPPWAPSLADSTLIRVLCSSELPLNLRERMGGKAKSPGWVSFRFCQVTPFTTGYKYPSLLSGDPIRSGQVRQIVIYNWFYHAFPNVSRLTTCEQMMLNKSTKKLAYCCSKIVQFNLTANIDISALHHFPVFQIRSKTLGHFRLPSNMVWVIRSQNNLDSICTSIYNTCLDWPRMMRSPQTDVITVWKQGH